MPEPCPQCQAQNLSVRRYCRKCGALLGCARCGFVNDQRDRFCGGCGRDLAQDVEEADLTPLPDGGAAASPKPEAAPTAAAAADPEPEPEEPTLLGFPLWDLLAECDHSEAGESEEAGHGVGPVHMSQDELDQLFEQ